MGCSSATLKTRNPALERILHRDRHLRRNRRPQPREDATILAHYYQDGEIQELADFTGDSLKLARAATKVKTGTIVFCGVHFMAETAKMLNPDKRVLLPDLQAGCSLAESCPRRQARPLPGNAARATAGSSRPSPTSTAPPRSRPCPTGSSPPATPRQIIRRVPAGSGDPVRPRSPPGPVPRRR